MRIPKPFGEEYSVHIDNQRQKYKAANKTIIGYSEYFKLLLWKHAAIGLEYEPKEKLDSLNNANPKNAWLINFGEPNENSIEIILAVAD